MKEISDENFREFIKYQKGIIQYKFLNQEPRTWETECIVYWGKSGSGKTRKVYDENEVSTVYAHPGGQWFDGYDSEEVVLFDDFGGHEFKLTYLLKLMDRYPMKVPIKGAFVQWVPRKIYFTSNLHPKEWYPNILDEHKNALLRRIKLIIHFDSL